jgi:hypothetical protein
MLHLHIFIYATRLLISFKHVMPLLSNTPATARNVSKMLVSYQAFIMQALLLECRLNM